MQMLNLSAFLMYSAESQKFVRQVTSSISFGSFILVNNEVIDWDDRCLLLFSFKWPNPRHLFCLFMVFSNTNFTERCVRLQWDLNLDCQSRRQACGPLDHGPIFGFIFTVFNNQTLLYVNISHYETHIFMQWCRKHSLTS